MNDQEARAGQEEARTAAEKEEEEETVMPVTKDNVADVFTYHAPSPDQQVVYEKLRSSAREFTHAILELTPTCADQQAAIRLVREAVMTANAAIALEGKI